MGRLVPDDKTADVKAMQAAEELTTSTTELNKIWYQWVQGSSGGQVSPAVIIDDKFKSFKDTISTVITDATALIKAIQNIKEITSVKFTPASVEVPVGTDNSTITYTIEPQDATEELVFSAPEANKSDFTVDTGKKTVTVTRNDKAPKYSITVKGKTSGNTVGTLPVEFKVKPPDVNITAVTFSPTEVTLKDGDAAKEVTYTIEPSNANEDYNFTIPEANKADVTVDKSGKKLTIKYNAGVATYNITVQGVRGKQDVGTLKVNNTPKPVAVKSVTFSPDNITAEVGTDTANSTYTVVPEGDTKK